MQDQGPSELADVDRLADDLYETLRTLARRALGRGSATLDPTDLVHQAWLRLPAEFNALSRVRLLALSATVMRRMAIDEARRTAARGDRERITLTSIASESERSNVNLLGLDEALQRLQEVDARWARIVELRFFGGLTGDEVAAALGLSRKTVVRDWALARAWLKSALDE